MMIADFLLDGAFAAVAAIGFGAVSDPPVKAFGSIALLAAVGHVFRFFLMNCCGMDIGFSSFLAASLIGILSLRLGKMILCPMTCLYIPALLPMIPGVFAYKTIFYLILFLQNIHDSTEIMHHLLANAMITVSVIFLLAAGAIIPLLLFSDYAYSLTRRRRRRNVKKETI